MASHYKWDCCPEIELSCAEGINVTIPDNAQYARAFAYNSANLIPYQGTSNGTAQEVKYRIIQTENCLGIDETKLNQYANNPAEYWVQAMRLIGPRPWMKIDLIKKYLAKCRPLGRPSNNQAWRELKIALQCAGMAGSKVQWADDAEILVFRIDPELIEAVRIAGDAVGGMGTMPTAMADLLKQTCLFWLIHDPLTRIIPPPWRWWAKEMRMCITEPSNPPNPKENTPIRVTIPRKQSGLDHSGSLSGVSTPDAEITGSSDESLGLSIKHKKTELSSLLSLEPKSRNGTEVQPLHTAEASGSKNPTPSQAATFNLLTARAMSSEDYVTNSPTAQRRLEYLRNKSFSDLHTSLYLQSTDIQYPEDPEDSREVWQATVATIRHIFEKINNHDNRILKTIRNEIDGAIQNATFEGPIEAHIKQIVGNAFAKAGLANDRERSHTLLKVMWQDKKEINKLVDAAVKAALKDDMRKTQVKYEKAIEHLQNQNQQTTERIDKLEKLLHSSIDHRIAISNASNEFTESDLNTIMEDGLERQTANRYDPPEHHNFDTPMRNRYEPLEDDVILIE